MPFSVEQKEKIKEIIDKKINNKNKSDLIFKYCKIRDNTIFTDVVFMLNHAYDENFLSRLESFYDTYHRVSNSRVAQNNQQESLGESKIGDDGDVTNKKHNTNQLPQDELNSDGEFDDCDMEVSQTFASFAASIAEQRFQPEQKAKS